MNLPLVLIGVFVGGGAGSLLRFGMARGLSSVFPEFPWGTLAANLLGTFLIGLFGVWFMERGFLDSPWKETLIIGFLGGLTTFSTFSHDSYVLLTNNRIAELALYLFGNLVVGFLLLLFGRYAASA